MGKCSAICGKGIRDKGRRVQRYLVVLHHILGQRAVQICAVGLPHIVRAKPLIEGCARNCGA